MEMTPTLYVQTRITPDNRWTDTGEQGADPEAAEASARQYTREGLLARVINDKGEQVWPEGRPE